MPETRPLQFYGYAKCSTCRAAKAQLIKQGRVLRELDITATPPPASVLRAILASGHHRLADLFNRSGELYRSLGMREKLTRLPEPELLRLLATHGRLVKRPIVTDGTRHTVGFRRDDFARVWS